jgi:nucleoid-associated protein YgaU
MSEREVREAAIACPFVAFDDDRDHRSDRPDHRHRCFAEVRPASRASEPSSTSVVPPPQPTHPPEPEWSPGRPADRDWAAPPPWLSSAPATSARAGTASYGQHDAEAEAGSVSATPPSVRPSSTDGPPDDVAEPPSFLTGAGHSAPSAQQPRARTSTERDAAATGAAAAPSWSEEAVGAEVEPDEPRRFGPAAGRRRSRPPADPDAPSWERARRNEAYPTLRTRTGLSIPGGSPLVIAGAGIIGLALALFFIPPMLLGLGGDEATATPTPSPSAEASASPSPTAVPSPTPVTYVVKSGDTMSRIAAQFGVTLDALIAANKETVPNPDQLQVGQTIIIPTAPANEIPGASPSG